MKSFYSLIILVATTLSLNFNAMSMPIIPTDEKVTSFKPKTNNLFNELVYQDAPYQHQFGFHRTVAYYPDLIELDLSDFNLLNVKLEDLDLISDLYLKLESVNLSRAKISNEMLVMLSQEFVWSDLKKLNLSGNMLISDQVVAYMCHFFNKLESLNLSSCYNLNLENIEINFSHLKILILNGSLLSSKAILNLCKQCPNLEELGIMSTIIEDQDLKTLCQATQRTLKKLHLGNTKITNETITFIRNTYPNVELLGLDKEN